MKNGYLVIRVAEETKYIDHVAGYRFATLEDNQRANAGVAYSLVVKSYYTGKEETIKGVTDHSYKEGNGVSPQWTVLYWDEDWDMQVARLNSFEECARWEKACDNGVIAVVPRSMEKVVLDEFYRTHPEE